MVSVTCQVVKLARKTLDIKKLKFFDRKRQLEQVQITRDLEDDTIL